MNKVLQIEDMHGKLCVLGDDIQGAFLSYYQDLLGTHTATDPSIFSIPKSKSPGTDGFNSQFYRDAWDIVGEEVCAAIADFFSTGKLLNQINSTVITLIPKVDRPTSVKHFRPISCCNVIYKLISKILCTRLALILPDIISQNQGAFVKGRSILENILICQDLVRLYSRGMASPRCMFKLDLQKPYETIEWPFVAQMLEALNFPIRFRTMVMTCITTTSYSLNLNGASFGYFKGRRGLRQGDPISPLVFCICMEYLSRVLMYATDKWFFRYHPLCKSLKLTHLLFADDLLTFCKGETQSIMLLLRALATFSATSGLRVNATKSEVVFNGVTQCPDGIFEISGFTEAKRRGGGGLGIKEAGVWNVAMVGKLVNWIYTKADRLWVLWIDHVYMKGLDWDTYHPPQDSNWNWRNICKVRGLLSGGFHGNQWVADPKGYSISSGYQWLQGSHPFVPWYKDVWNDWNVPKQAFIAWLICRQALNTRVKLSQFGVVDTNNCVLCEGGLETLSHLFADCAYSQQILAGLENWLQKKLLIRTGNCSKVQTQVVSLTRTIYWYTIWMERNQCRLELKLRCPAQVIRLIQQHVQSRVKQKLKEIVQSRDMQWLSSIDINV
ncbi:uncharacterized protein LOC141628090 [Silene latifolia]|uniref:uncharacterized protein LOC141628090 n=1 Tax=Silene latifolia TaxID=37657 RepID=UPI003D76EF03